MRATNYSFISSFDHDFIARYKAYEEDMLTPLVHRAKFIHLATRTPDALIPGEEETSQWDRGCNIQVWAADKKIMEQFHQRDQLVGCWVDKEITHDEGPAIWNQLIDAGVDIFCTDHPLEVLEVLRNRQ